MAWKGRAARLRSILNICCALTGASNERSVNCPGLLLGPAGTPLLGLFALLRTALPARWRAKECGTASGSEMEDWLSRSTRYGLGAAVRNHGRR